MSEYLVIIILVLLGLALGSFINAFVWRLYMRTKSKAAKYSILTGRSMCPDCKHKLNALDLIPVISWLMLGGKCRYCHKSISAQYPIVEIVTTLLFTLSYLYWPYTFSSQGVFFFVIWLIILINLIALAVYDIKWLTLPNKIIYSLYGLVIAQIVATLIFFKGDMHYLFNSLVGLLIGGGVFYLLFQVSSGKWIGGGDVKLGAVLGLYLGSALDAVLMIFFASIIGSLLSIPFLATGKLNRKTLIPYGPFLILAAIILQLFGTSIRSWLNNKGIYL